MTSLAFFFGDWWPVVRILVVGVPMYIALVILLRVSGSRTIASMTVFDFVVTVAIGSVFGRALTATDVALAEAVVAFLLLIVMQYIVSWIQIRWPRFRRLVTNRPALLYARQEFQRDAMREQRVSEDELRAAVRKKNLGSMDDVEAIVLESSGDVSVIKTLDDGSALSEGLRNQLPTQRSETDD